MAEKQNLGTEKPTVYFCSECVKAQEHYNRHTRRRYFWCYALAEVVKEDGLACGQFRARGLEAESAAGMRRER